MDLISDGSNNTINFFSNSVDDIFSNYLAATYSIFAKYCTPEIVIKTTALRIFCFALIYTRLAIFTNNKIVQKFVQVIKGIFCSFCSDASFYVWEQCLYQQLICLNIVKTMVLNQIK